MKIVLYQPQIPQNTGSVARTCAAAGADLVLVRPLGFSTSSRQLKRAGLDYWGGVHVEEIDDLLPLIAESPSFFFSSKATTPYTAASIPLDAALIFGSETSGLPELFWEKWPDRFFTIPMTENTRSLNLSCSVSIILYEALRQNHFLFPKKIDSRKERAILINAAVAKGR